MKDNTPRAVVLTLTPEQEATIQRLLSNGPVFGEILLCSENGGKSQPRLFCGQLSTKAANKVRKALNDDAPKPTTQTDE